MGEIYSLDDELRDYEGAEKTMSFLERLEGIPQPDLERVRSRISELRNSIKYRNEEILKEDKESVFHKVALLGIKRKGETRSLAVFKDKYENKFDFLWEVNKIRDVSSINVFLYK